MMMIMMIIRFEERHGFVCFQKQRKKERVKRRKNDFFLLGEERKEGAKYLAERDSGNSRRRSKRSGG